MKLQDALKLHNEDEVTVKKTKQVVDVMLEDGNWYGYKEIS